MKEISIILFCMGFIKFGFCQSPSIYYVDSLLPISLPVKEILKIRKKYDQIIWRNLVGTWLHHGGELKINKKGLVKFYYHDTLRNKFRWEVKNGVIAISRTESIGGKGLYFTSRSKYRILYSSSDSLAMLPLQESPQSKILELKKKVP